MSASDPTTVTITVSYTSCSGVRCYYGKCDGLQKICICNEGYFGTHCEYTYNSAIMVDWVD